MPWWRPVPRVAVVTLALALGSCASAPVGEASPTVSVRATDEPVPAASLSSGIDEVTAPRVLGEVKVRSASPADAEVVAVDEPTRLEVAALSIDMPIESVGVDERGGMVIPEGALTAGWYRFGPAPGDPAGRAVLAAHVDNAQGTGPFARLRDIERGAAVVVTTASGERIHYEVVEIEQTDKDEVDLEAVFDADAPPALVMVTCGGDWQAEIGHYADNVIVTAAPVDVP